METPPPEPAMRRTTRSALVEIPARMGALTVGDNRYNGRTHTNIMTNLLVDTGEMNIPHSLISPAPSPDEMVIQARGRRRVPITWSPPDLRSTPTKDRTPVKLQSSIVLRSTPRKRLLMQDPETPSPESKKNGSPNAKKIRVEAPMCTFIGPVDTALKALSQDQLIEVIQGIVSRHPHLEEDIKQNLPAPDLRPVMDRLHDLKRNIFKSLPNSRLTSKTDSPAYNRASTHVLAFKKSLVEAGRGLSTSQQWDTVLKFVLVAWEQVAGTPLWDNPPHNAARRQCFKFLATQCMLALKKIPFLTADFAATLKTKLEEFASDSDDIQTCLKQLETVKRK